MCSAATLFAKKTENLKITHPENGHETRQEDETTRLFYEFTSFKMH